MPSIPCRGCLQLLLHSVYGPCGSNQYYSVGKLGYGTSAYALAGKVSHTASSGERLCPRYSDRRHPASETKATRIQGLLEGCLM